MINLSLENRGAIFGTLLGVVAMVLFTLVVQQTDWTTIQTPVILFYLGVEVVAYLIATITVKKTAASQEPPATALMRGILIGANAFANAYLAALFLRNVLGVGDPVGPIVGIVIGAIAALACIGPVSQAEVYQGIIGWLNWLMPMSWLVVALGLVFVLVSAILHVIYWIAKWNFFRVGIPSGNPLAGHTFSVDWPTGTLSMYGGMVANLNYLGTAFNMGNFSFVHRNASSTHTDHEAGHSLNLAAFGSVFHFIGAIDENVPAIGSGSRAFSEVLAESNDTSSGHHKLHMWS
jgi:hypothetical protein